MSCRCDAAYERAEDCPRCSGELPDGPDELLSEMAENESEPETLHELLGVVPLDEDDIPTEPMLPLSIEPTASVVRVQDAVRCVCDRWCPIEFVARSEDVRPNVMSPLCITCECGTRIGVIFSWGRGCITSVRHVRPDETLN